MSRQAMLSRSDAQTLDDRDRLREVRESFILPEGVIFMGGNSLGPLSRPVCEGVDALVRDQWGRGLLRSWNAAGWIDAPRRIGDKIGRLIGAAPGQVVAADSTTVDLYKLLAGGLKLTGERRAILTEAGNFPTDLFVAQGVAAASSVEIRTAPRQEVLDRLDEAVGIVMLTHVDYVTAHVYDLAGITRAAHEAGALILWDLSHSAGAVPVDLDGCEADLAVGCGYKYLNGGPGAPAYLYVAERHQERLTSPIWGWMGDATPFAFSAEYAPAPDIGRFLAGTPPMLSMAALEVAIDLWLQVDRDLAWAKSRALSELMIRLVDDRAAPLGVTVASPRDVSRRGSHLALQHPEAYAVMRALIARGVIGDFRPPDVMRFAVTPLYHRYVDVWDAIDALVEVLQSRAYDRDEYRARLKVT